LRFLARNISNVKRLLQRKVQPRLRRNFHLLPLVDTCTPMPVPPLRGFAAPLPPPASQSAERAPSPKAQLDRTGWMVGRLDRQQAQHSEFHRKYSCRYDKSTVSPKKLVVSKMYLVSKLLIINILQRNWLADFCRLGLDI